MIEVRTRDRLREERARLGGGSVALVPTMGALHEGHLSLIDEARGVADHVACSVFVNPLQFGPGEDLDRYPRDLDGDMHLLRDRGVDLVFAPEPPEMYPEGNPVVTVDPGDLAERLCGLARPGHFRGVLTVVARLFGLFRPELAVFGQKDFQQSVLVRRMVTDLELGVGIVVAPIVREEDGLALSSRNVMLDERARPDAVGLYRGLSAAESAFAAGERDAGRLEEAIRAATVAFPGLELEYAEVVRPEDLSRPERAEEGHVAAVAGWCGGIRLIDNLRFGSPPGGR